MNKATLQVAEYVAKHFATCTLEHARELQSRMEQNGLNFSECSTREFNRAIVTAYQETN